MRATGLAMVLVMGVSWGVAQAAAPVQDTNLKVFQNGFIEVSETSEAGQTRYQAVRSAKVLAQREILEILEGLRLYGNTQVKDGMLASDKIQTQVEGFIRGAVECGVDYDTAKGLARVCLRLNVPQLYGMMPLFQQEGVSPEPKAPFAPDPALVRQAVFGPSQAGAAAGADQAPSERYDGIILDVRGYGFKPALENRVLTSDDSILFDHSKVAGHILIDRGSSGYAVDAQKARALLDSWGSHAPLTLKSRGIKNVTDAEVSAEDAARIYHFDQEANILAQGRVVFLLQ